MSILIDNSTQLPQTTFTSGAPDFANVNDWSKIASNLYNTSLGNIGIGTTNPNGYKLNIVGSLNSTSLHQNGTQIDFSSYATNTALTNGLATKQNNLTALTNLLGMGSAITDIDYNKITLNKPSTFPAIMTDIYTKGETNNLVNAKQNTLTAATNLLGTGGSITGINFNTVINKPTYNTPLSSNISTNVISVDLSSKQNTLTSATTLLGTGGSITGINFNTVINKPTYNTPLSSNVSTNVISVDLSSKQDTLTSATNLLGIGSSITAIDYAKITVNKPTNFQSDWTSTIINKPTNFQSDWTTTIINRPTNFQADWNSTVINRPTSFPANMTDIYTKTETNTLLNAKEAILTFSSPIIRTTNTISLNQSLIDFNNLTNKPDMNLYLLKSGGAMTGNLTNTGNISIGTTNISSRLTVNNIVEDRGLFDHALSPMTITHQTRTSTGLLNDPQPILHLCRQGTDGQAFGARATFSLCRFINSSTNSRTRMDISLANDAYDDNNIMTLLSSGNVGIGITNILSRLTIRGRFDDGNTGGLCINSFDGNVYNLRLYAFSPAGSQVSYNFQVNNIASSVNALTIAHNGNIGIGSTIPNALLNVFGKALIHNGAGLPPVNGTYGNDGARLILWPGAADNVAYSLGIAGGTLWYAVPTGAIHAFYVGTTERLRIDISGNLTSTGTITSGALSYVFAGGLRIGGWDTFNTLYAGARDLGLTVDSGRSIRFSTWSGASDIIMTLNNTSITLNKNTTINGNLTTTENISAKYYVLGETYSFNANWNSTGSSGWFVPLNGYWYSGHSCLNVSIYAMNVAGSNAFCWFGRVYVSIGPNGTPPATLGGIIQIITDYRNPTVNSANNNYISVNEKWDGQGNNTLWIQINSFTFGGNMKVKIYG